MAPAMPKFTSITFTKGGDAIAHGTTPKGVKAEAVAVTLVRRGGAILQGEEKSATGTTWRVKLDRPSKPLRDGEDVFCIGVLVHATPTQPPKDGDDPKVWKHWVKVEAH